MDISFERPITGGWRLSTIADGHLVQRLYMGYTKKEALRLFRQEIKKTERARAAIAKAKGE